MSKQTKVHLLFLVMVFNSPLFGQKSSKPLGYITGTTYGLTISDLPIYGKGGKTRVDTNKQTQPFVNVVIDGTTSSVESEVNGNFQIEIPKELQGKKITLTFSYPGWITQHDTIDTSKPIKLLKIYLQADSTF